MTFIVDKIINFIPIGENALVFLQQRKIDGKKFMVHRAPFKVIINPILRFIQFYTDRPFVIASEFSKDFKQFHGYKLKAIKRI